MSVPTPSGQITTFYSYKGGTGRSLILANVAWILASSGKRVLTVDWDLEAPGLHRYFEPFMADPQLTRSDGVIDLVSGFVKEAVTGGKATPPVVPGMPRWRISGVTRSHSTTVFRAMVLCTSSRRADRVRRTRPASTLSTGRGFTSASAAGRSLRPFGR